jgi:hypothetical protein
MSRRSFLAGGGAPASFQHGQGGRYAAFSCQGLIHRFRRYLVVSTAGSWEAGVDGALPGMIMKTDPQVGVAYRQEYYRDQAEDMAKVLHTGAFERVPFRSFERLLVTQGSPLEPKVVEEKYNAKGFGLVLEKTVRGGSDRAELLSYQAAP